MARTESGTRLVVLAVLLVGVVAAILWLGERDGGGIGDEAGPALPAEVAPEAPERTTVVAPAEGIPAVAAGQTLVVDAARVAAEGLDLDLELGEPSATGEPLVALVVSEKGRLDLFAVLAEDRRSARVRVEPGRLTPGRYMVQVRTTEKTALPLRRYVLDVR